MSGVSAGPGDRLGLTTTFALALHALVLFGLDFRFEDPLRAALPALDVILVQSSSPEPPEKADFLAQANQQGGGDSDEAVRPSAPFSAPARLRATSAWSASHHGGARSSGRPESVRSQAMDRASRPPRRSSMVRGSPRVMTIARPGQPRPRPRCATAPLRGPTPGSRRGHRPGRPVNRPSGHAGRLPRPVRSACAAAEVPRRRARGPGPGRHGVAAPRRRNRVARLRDAAPRPRRGPRSARFRDTVRRGRRMGRGAHCSSMLRDPRRRPPRGGGQPGAPRAAAAAAGRPPCKAPAARLLRDPPDPPP